MTKEIGLKDILINVFFLFICLSTLFITSSDFVDSKVLPKWYSLYMLTLSACLFGSIFTNTINIKIDKITILLFIFITYLLVNRSFYFFYGTASISQYTAFILLFLFLKFNERTDDTVPVLCVISVCTLQAIYGILQFSGVINNYSIFDTFDNPAGFAACLSTGYAFGFYFWDKKKYLKYLSLVAMLIMVVAVTLSNSRTGIISILTISFLFLNFKFKLRLTGKKKFWLVAGVLFLVTSLMIFLFFYKKNSAIGRLFIWETTIGMIKIKSITGWGGGAFSSQYMLHQAEYFNNHPNNPNELLADNVVHSFNEYLLLVAEHGLIGLTLLLILLFLIYKNRTNINIAYWYSILSILLFSCFSYPLHYPFIWFVLAFSIAKLSNNSFSINYQIKINKYSKPFLKIICISILLFLSYHLIQDIRFEHRWKKVIMTSSSEKTEEVMSLYKVLYLQWNGNPLFLYNYGAELNYMDKNAESIPIFKECMKFYNDYDLQMLQADNYFSLKNWGNAEQYYKTASQMCPNRFLPLQGLMHVYESLGKKDKVIDIAKYILAKPIKINTSLVLKIKNEAQQKLDILL